MKSKFLRILVIIPVAYIVASILLVLLMKWVPVVYTPLMLKRSIQTDYKRTAVWMPIEKISRNLAAAVVASEDQRFYTHNGFDFDEIEKVMSKPSRKGRPVRGCSTISQQTAKNCFTWCSRTWFRKAVEAYYTVLIEWIWGKNRIMEVYLNVAEMGPGIYGAEAASQRYFKKPASKLTLSDSASLACCLPNPLRRTPAWAERRMGSRRARIIHDAPHFF